jgi:hypothetical protein
MSQDFPANSSADMSLSGAGIPTDIQPWFPVRISIVEQIDQVLLGNTLCVFLNRIVRPEGIESLNSYRLRKAGSLQPFLGFPGKTALALLRKPIPVLIDEVEPSGI